MGERRRGWGEGQRRQERSIVPVVSELVEAKYDREAARAEPERFGEARPHPEPPEDFANLAKLADYHRQVQEYETAIDTMDGATLMGNESLDSRRKLEEAITDVLREGRSTHSDAEAPTR